MAVSKYPSPEYLRQCFRYEDGKLFWLQRPREHFSSDAGYARWSGTFPSKEAGSLQVVAGRNRTPYSRCIINMRGKILRRSSIVWAIHKDEIVIGLDHENRNSIDDRIENLRIASNPEQAANKGDCRNGNNSGYRGVYFYKDRISKPWSASISFGNKRTFLGYFPTAELAHQAYLDAVREIHKDFAFNRIYEN